MYYCVLDFEANCSNPTNPAINEIIEFPGILYKSNENDIKEISRFESFVKPRDNNKITDFCTELTSITQNDVDNAEFFDIVFKKYNKWLSNIEECEQVYFNESNFVFVTCGNWDLKIMLPKDLERWNINKIPSIWKNWINIKIMYSDVYKKKAFGMVPMLNELNIEHSGKHHRGIDDCENIGKILIRVLQDGREMLQNDHKIKSKYIKYMLSYTTHMH